MVLVRFEEKKLRDFSGLPNDSLVKVPWLLGGEAREDGGDIVMEFNPDRPDLYSIQGITRAIRTFAGVEKFVPQVFRNEDLEVASYLERTSPLRLSLSHTSQFRDPQER